MSHTAPMSVLATGQRTSFKSALALAIAFHLAVFAAAFVLPRYFDRSPALRKPVIAHLVALGKPRDPHLMPRRETPPPGAAPSVPRPVLSQDPVKSAPAVKRPPTRQELMERAIARAAGHADVKPDEERTGQKTGSPEGTAQAAEEGDAYFSAVHDAILENYVVPSVISERERLYLSASVLAYIGKDGHILKYEFQKKSGNAFFDQALEIAIQRTKLPPPPPELARSLRDNGIGLNFRP